MLGLFWWICVLYMKVPKTYCFCVDGHGSISEGGKGEVRDDAKGEVGVEEGRLREIAWDW